MTFKGAIKSRTFTNIWNMGDLLLDFERIFLFSLIIAVVGGVGIFLTAQFKDKTKEEIEAIPIRESENYWGIWIIASLVVTVVYNPTIEGFMLLIPLAIDTVIIILPVIKLYQYFAKERCRWSWNYILNVVLGAVFTMVFFHAFWYFLRHPSVPI